MPEIETFEKALGNIAALFNQYNVEYMVIGGLANAKWGRPRATLDSDIIAWRRTAKLKISFQFFSGWGFIGSADWVKGSVDALSLIHPTMFPRPS